MITRGYVPDLKWYDMSYQGENMPRRTWDSVPNTKELNNRLMGIVYPEHNNEYLAECINNLATKGVFV